MLRTFSFLLIVIVFAGCSRALDVPASVWGSSTRALQEARVDAITKTYACTFRECYQAVLLIAKEENLTVFLKDINRQVIVLMDIPKSVDTTEVGVFFTEITEKEVKIYISSLSSHAKRIASEIIFPELEKSLSTVANDNPTVDEALDRAEQ